MNNDEVNYRALGVNNLPLIEIIVLDGLLWLGHVLCTSAHRLSFRALYAGAGQGMEEAMKRSGYELAWIYAEVVFGFGVHWCMSPSWLGPKRLLIFGCWLDTLRSQWRECNMVCL